MQTARELDVDFLLVGRVLLRGDRLRVQAELIDSARNAQIWGQSYTRQPSSVLEMEDEIAREILTQLRPKFGHAELKRVTKHDTDNAAAYQHYLKGRYYWDKRTSEDLTLGIQHFHKALEGDSEYALAHSGLADSYIALGSFGVLAPREIFPLAKAAGLRALEINDTLAEAHTSLATAAACYDCDWASAEEHFRSAIRIDPHYPIAYHWYGYCLCGYGKLQEGISLLGRAQQLDPLSLMIQTQLGSAYYVAREFERGETACLAALSMNSRFWTAHWFLGLIYQQRGLTEQATAELQQAVELSDSNTLALGSLAHHYGLMGKRAPGMRVTTSSRTSCGGSTGSWRPEIARVAARVADSKPVNSPVRHMLKVSRKLCSTVPEKIFKIGIDDLGCEWLFHKLLKPPFEAGALCGGSQPVVQHVVGERQRQSGSWRYQDLSRNTFRLRAGLPLHPFGAHAVANQD